MAARTRFDWHALRDQVGDLEPDDRRLFDLLADGKSTPQIAAVLGIHRSRIWRRAEALKARLGKEGAG